MKREGVWHFISTGADGPRPDRAAAKDGTGHFADRRRAASSRGRDRPLIWRPIP
jgi:hypothetical protein